MLPSSERVVLHLWTTAIPATYNAGQLAIPLDHPVLNHPQIRPMLRVLASPATTAQQMANALLLVAQRVRADRFGAPAFAMFAQNWCKGQWGPPANDPQYGGQDTLASPAPHAPVPAQCSMFVANAMPGAVAAGTALYNAVKATFDAASMPYPRVLAQDDESVIGFGAGNAFVQATIVGRGAASAADIGVWRPSLNDARAATQIVAPGLTAADGMLTLAAWESLRVAQGVPITPTGYEYIANATFRAWYNTFARYSWIVNQTSYTPARAAFGPQLLTSNYNDCIGSAATREPFNATFTAGQRRNYASCHAPVLYAPNLANLAAAGLRRFPLDDAAEYRHWMISQREAYQAAANAATGEGSKRHICYVQMPGQSLDGAPTPSVEHVAQVIAYFALNLGDEEFYVWGDDSPSNADTALALIDRVNTITSGRRHLFA